MKSVFEILIPSQFNDRKTIHVEHHYAFDDFVKGIAGGLTILRSGMGYWVDLSGETYKERMIPVRIICSDQEIEQIGNFALTHYKQKAILYYKIGTELVFLRQQ